MNTLRLGKSSGPLRFPLRAYAFFPGLWTLPEKTCASCRQQREILTARNLLPV